MNQPNYSHLSHSHCWDQKQPSACGIPLEKHKQCCLCDLLMPRPSAGWSERFDERFWLHRVPKNTKQSRDVKAFIATELDRAREEERDRIIERIKKLIPIAGDSITVSFDESLEKAPRERLAASCYVSGINKVLSHLESEVNHGTT